jgi:hypothetical protein
LVRLAQDEMQDALTEFDRELQVIDLHRLYGREYAMEAWQGRGFALLRAGRPGDAAAAARCQVSAVLPAADTAGAAGRPGNPDARLRRLPRDPEHPRRRAEPIEAAIARAPSSPPPGG